MLVPVCSPELGTHTAAMAPRRGQGPEAAQVLYSLQVWGLVDDLLVLKNRHQHLPQGSRYHLTQNFCCSCLPKKLLSVFHPAAFQIIDMTNSPLLIAQSKLLHSSLSSLICIFPFLPPPCQTQK